MIGTAHEAVCEQATTKFKIDKTINRTTSGLVDQTIGIVDVNLMKNH